MEKHELLYTKEELEAVPKILHEMEMEYVLKDHASDNTEPKNTERIKTLMIAQYATTQLVWEVFYKNAFIAKYETEYL